MSDKQDTRRNFLKILGLTAGATLAGTSSFAALKQKEEILKLNPEQQEFMLQYEKWMDESIEAIRTQKANPENPENFKKMMEQAQTAEAWQPKLNAFMKDRNFSLIYHASVERMKKEIE